MVRFSPDRGIYYHNVNIKIINYGETMKRFILFFAGVLTVASVFAYSSGPPDSKAGNPPTNNYCTQCHASFTLNSGTGTLAIEGLPENGFVPENTYSLTVTLDDPNMMRGGFEVTVIYDAGGGNYLMGGGFEVTDPTNTQLSDNTGSTPDFMKQTSTGSHAGTSGPFSWSFDWVAPVELADMVTFYIVGNAANNNSSTNGDYIYGITEEVTQALPPEPPVVSDIPDQTITAGESFTTINLDDFVEDPDTPDDQITWSYSGNTDLMVEILNRIATITPPTVEWTGVETVTFTAADPDMLEDSDDAVFTVEAVWVKPGADAGIPTEFAVSQNFPNPFNASTSIEFSIPDKSLVELNIFDLNGRLVLAPLSQELNAGVYTANVDLQSLPSGVYLYQIKAGALIAGNKMVLLK